jgi:hypothetical protein
MRRAAHDGDLAQVESTWVLAAALMREAARDPAGRAALEREARGYVEGLTARYPANPVFQRFLREVPAKTSAAEAIGTLGAAPAAIAGTPVRRHERGEFAEHVVHVTRHDVRRDVEPPRNFSVAESRLDQLFDFLLPLGEAHGAGARRESIGGLACENIAHARDGPVAATPRTAPTLDTANGPRHTHPLLVPGVAYFAPRTSGIHRGDELIHDESLF